MTGPPAAEVLSVRGLRKEFPGVVALDGVDFSVRRGEVHALLGANGAGKSTLIKIVAGLYRADGGEIRIDGRQAQLGQTRQATALGVCVIHQDLALVPHLSVAENLFLGRELMTRWGLVDWRRTHAEARRLLDLVGIDAPSTTKVATLSMGRRQLVEIAKALSVKARILILDEPTASLSHGEAETLFALVRRLARDGVGIVYVSHRLEEIAPLVDRVTILRDGRSVGTYAIGELDRGRIVALITGRDRPSPRHGSGAARAAGDTVLELRGLGRPKEFVDISLALRRGEILVLTGLVGAGRTELVETIFGARVAQAGEILIGGRAVRLDSPGDAVRHGVALIPEDRRGHGLATIMPVAHNVTLAALRHFARWGVLNLRREIQHVGRLIRELAIRTPGALAPAGLLSGGNQQKVVLAKWLSTDAGIFLLDEPTQGVDVGAKDEIYRLLREIAAAGKGVLVVSSDLEEVMGLADRILVLRQGRLVGEFINRDLDANRLVDAITHGEAA
jgi:ribose transport system ATP-binding protein